MRTKLILVLCSAVSLQVNATPLDVRIGATVEDLEAQGLSVEPDEATYEYVMIAPGQQPEDQVRALITPKRGLCEMRWTMRIEPLSPSGAELKSKYVGLYEAGLQAIGEPSYRDSVKDLKTDDQRWRSIYLQEDRVVLAWEKPMTTADVTSLKLEAWSEEPNVGLARMTISAPWIGECLEEQKNGQTLP